MSRALNSTMSSATSIAMSKALSKQARAMQRGDTHTTSEIRAVVTLVSHAYTKRIKQYALLATWPKEQTRRVEPMF